MTIREMQKVYKKVLKNASDFMMYKSYLDKMEGISEEMVVNCKLVTKAANNLLKIAVSLGVTLSEMRMHILTEESFVEWCLLNRLELNGTDSEDETDDETEGE